MRLETENWWKQSLKDLESAEKNLEIGEFYVSVFLCQQAVEKALKALYVEQKIELPLHGHSLIYLAKELKLPEKYHTFLRELTPEFVTTRYPDAANGVPYEMYDEKIALEVINGSKGVIEWIKSLLLKQ